MALSPFALQVTNTWAITKRLIFVSFSVLETPYGQFDYFHVGQTGTILGFVG